MIETNVKTRVVGVDISADRTIYAVVDIRGNIIAKAEFPTTDYPNVNDFVAVLAERIIMLVEENGGYESIRSVGVSVLSGNFHTGSIENAANLPWKGVIPIAAMLRDRMGLAVALDNNANVAAMAEHNFGVAHGLNDFVLITMGSGLGSCIYSEGRVHEGANGYAGEIGHTCLIPHGRTCGCGKQGCLEAYTAKKGIILTAQEVLSESDAPSLMRDAENLSPRLISQYCEEGDALAQEVMRRVGQSLGQGLANYASVLNPEAFIFAGGIAHAGHWLFDPMIESFEEHVFHNAKGSIRFLQASLNDEERDVLGASALAWSVKEYSLFK